MNVILAQPRGFCAGVVRAIDIVERALDAFGPPVYVLHEIVHNRHVVEGLARRGAVFVERLEEVPKGAVTVFSAHGVSRAVEQEAEDRGLGVVDATCPLVRKVHGRVRLYEKEGKQVILIGHAGHPEVEGTRGQSAAGLRVVSTEEEARAVDVPDPERVAYVTQTTLSMDDTRSVIAALRDKYPAVGGPDLEDICYATQNRQNAVRELAHRIDVLLVVGASNSSNSNRLREVGESLGVPSHLIDRPADVDPGWFTEDSTVGLTAGASAPESLVRAVLDRLEEFGADSIEEMDGIRETTVFPLPPALSLRAAAEGS